MADRTDILPPRYRSPKRIGAGGMGEIYSATDETLGRTVAVKVLAERYAEDADIRARFTREALAAARLSGDPHTVTIFDVGEWNGRPFIVMEELTGGSVEQRLRQGRPASAQALTWLQQAASALDAAHRAGVVHRDVKPGNLLLDGEDSLHVADFGVASAAGTDALTMIGTVLGTAGYLAPEQARGERATPASDRYALAVVAYELLTGSRPFAEGSPPGGAAPPVHDRDPALPGALDGVFARALDSDPGRRPETAGGLVADLRSAYDSADARTQVAEPPTQWVQPVAGRRSRRGPLLVLLGLLLAGAAGAAIAALVGGRGDAPRTAAPPASVRTVTARGATVRQTVTVTTEQTPPTPPPRRPARTPAVVPVGDGHALNDQGYARLRAGDPAGALPLLVAAARALARTGPADPYEGYANYNAGVALLELGRCAEARPYLEHAQHLEKGRREPREALKRAKRC